MPLEFGPPAKLDGELERLAPRLGLALSQEERTKLLEYLALIQRWTQVYNLTAVRNTGEMFTHHLLDCLAIIQPLRREMTARGHDGDAAVLDVGSGAGLPGAVIAMLNPGWTVTCVDAVAKKTTFLRQVSAELRVPNLLATHGRVEAKATLGTAQFDLISSRAFASLKDFAELTAARLADGGCWAAMKAKLTDDEAEALPPTVDMFHVEQLAVPSLDAARCLVWMQPAAATIRR